MIPNLFDGNRAHLFSDKTGQSLMEPHAQRADALRTKPYRGGQDQRGSIRFKQISRADIRLKTAGNQRNDVGESFCRLAGLRGERFEIFECQYMSRVAFICGSAHLSNPF